MNDGITGFLRTDGRFGTRNHVLVLPTVACVNGVVNHIARQVPRAVCVPHAHGCGRAAPRDVEILFRTLTGMLHNPNVGAVVLIGLGCEVSNLERLLPLLEKIGKPLTALNVQTDGGSLKVARQGARVAQEYVDLLAAQERVPMPWSDLLVGLECGGSDAMSGVTANVAVGSVADWLVDQGATVMFGENTEMIGTAHILARRARTPEVAGQIETMVASAEQRAQDLLGDLASRVISPGNMDGGMSTIAEKSMGCIFKGGSTPIMEVVDYAQAPSAKGLVLQDGPGYDPDSITGFAASGAQLMFFSTGRGTPAGCPAVPVIKVASNTRTFRAMPDDMDVNAGRLIEGLSKEILRDEMLALMQRVVNGEPTKAEQNGMDVFTFLTMGPPF